MKFSHRFHRTLATSVAVTALASGAAVAAAPHASAAPDAGCESQMLDRWAGFTSGIDFNNSNAILLRTAEQTGREGGIRQEVKFESHTCGNQTYEFAEFNRKQRVSYGFSNGAFTRIAGPNIRYVPGGVDMGD